MSKPQPNLNSTQPNLSLGFTRKWLYTTHHQPPTTTHLRQTQRQRYLSYYLPDFDQTLKVGSWDHLGQDKVS